jgi:MFS family permease
MVGATLFAFVDRQVFALVAAPMVRDLHLTDSQLGMIQGLGFALFGLVATYPLGWLCDRIDRRIVLAGCIAVWAGGTAACGLVNSFGPLLAASMAVAAGEAGLVPIVYAAIPDLFRGRDRVSANQIFYVATILGSAAGLLLGGMSAAGLDAFHAQLPVQFSSLAPWRLVFLAVAAPAPILIVLVLCASLGRARTSDAVVEREDLSAFGTYLVRHGRGLALILTALCAYGLPFGALLAYTPVALSRLYGTSPGASGVGMGLAIAVGCIIGVGIAAGLMRRLTPRFGARTPLRISALTMLLLLPSMAALPWITSEFQAYFILALQMATGTLIGSLLPNIIQALAPMRLRGRTTAFYSILSAVVNGLAIYVVGPISDAIGARPQGLLFAVAAVGLLSWIPAAWLMWRAERPFEALSKAVAAADAIDQPPCAPCSGSHLSESAQY